jgi:hypothetical protein
VKFLGPDWPLPLLQAAVSNASVRCLCLEGPNAENQPVIEMLRQRSAPLPLLLVGWDAWGDAAQRQQVLPCVQAYTDASVASSVELTLEVRQPPRQLAAASGAVLHMCELMRMTSSHLTFINLGHVSSDPAFDQNSALLCSALKACHQLTSVVCVLFFVSIAATRAFFLYAGSGYGVRCDLLCVTGRS